MQNSGSQQAAEDVWMITPNDSDVSIVTVAQD